MRVQAIFVGLACCALSGCLVPAQDAIKGSDWPGAGNRSGQSAEAMEKRVLIKPYIPPEQDEPPASPGEDQQQASRSDLYVQTAPGQPSRPHYDPPQDPYQGVASGQTQPPLRQPQPGSGYAQGPSETHPMMPYGQQKQPSDARPSQQQPATPAAASELPGQVPLRVDTSGQTPQLPRPEPPASAAVAPQPQPQPQPQQPPPVTARPAVPSQPEPKAATQEWEDQKIKAVAQGMAAKNPAVKAGKICYSAKTDEWWIVLYEDAGAVYDLKQFVWNRTQEKTEPFLVVKQVPKARLDEHLRQSEPDKSCRPIELTPQVSGPYPAPAARP